MAPEPAMALARSPLQGQPQEDGGELGQMALDVAGSLDPREVIARILERGTHVVRADRGTLSSLVDDQVVVEATYGRGGELTWVGQRYSLDYFEGQPLVKQAIESLQSAFGDRLGLDQDAHELRLASHAQSAGRGCDGSGGGAERGRVHGCTARYGDGRAALPALPGRSSGCRRRDDRASSHGPKGGRAVRSGRGPGASAVLNPGSPAASQCATDRAGPRRG